MKRTATAAQKAAAAARREKMRAMAKQIAALSEPERIALARRAGGIVTIEGHPLSIKNQCMVVMQSSRASVVGGFQQWRRAGRFVQKGEHGASIWVPTGTTKNGSDFPEGEESGEAEKSSCRFVLATVFDISQTAPVELAAAA